jgi:hypothetical protein
LQRFRLPRGQSGYLSGQWLQYLVQCRETDALLELGADDTQYAEAGFGFGSAQCRGVQQRAFAHSGLSGQQQRGTPRDGGAEELVDDRHFR